MDFASRTRHRERQRHTERKSVFLALRALPPSFFSSFLVPCALPPPLFPASPPPTLFLRKIYLCHAKTRTQPSLCSLLSSPFQDSFNSLLFLSLARLLFSFPPFASTTSLPLLLSKPPLAPLLCPFFYDCLPRCPSPLLMSAAGEIAVVAKGLAGRSGRERGAPAKSGQPPPLEGEAKPRLGAGLRLSSLGIVVALKLLPHQSIPTASRTGVGGTLDRRSERGEKERKEEKKGMTPPPFQPKIPANQNTCTLTYKTHGSGCQLD